MGTDPSRRGTPADFSGVMHRADMPPVAIAFDCKVITGAARYRHAERDRHQLESLLHFRAAGGRAFLLLHCRALDRVWLLEDLDALWRREAVLVRSRKRRRATDRGQRSVPLDAMVEVQYHLPALAPSAASDVARRDRPRWDYVTLLPRTTEGT